jgi:hypothetical protein
MCLRIYFTKPHQWIALVRSLGMPRASSQHRPNKYMLGALPASAALKYSFAAFERSNGTPRPCSYMFPRAPCEYVCPCHMWIKKINKNVYDGPLHSFIHLRALLVHLDPSIGK